MRTPYPKYLNLEFFFDQFFKLLKAAALKLLDLARFLSGDGFKYLSIFISLLLFIGIIIVIVKYMRMDKEKLVSIKDAFIKEGNVTERNEKWDLVIKKLSSENPSDWKMAVIEADSLIDEIMEKSGHTGNGLGERLKNVDPTEFVNLQNVWDAHKLRNRIAHDPNTSVPKKEAEDAVAKFEKALKEFKYL